jgi:hypothetical protein
MKTIHQKTTTAIGQQASYGIRKGTPWIAYDHGQHRHCALFAIPGWRNGLGRIRELINRHGIQIKPEHQGIFSILNRAA